MHPRLSIWKLQQRLAWMKGGDSGGTLVLPVGDGIIKSVYPGFYLDHLIGKNVIHSVVPITYIDGTIIVININDLFIGRKWFRVDIDYLCTIDVCILPSFEKIHFSDTPLRSMHIENAGGASEISEALSMQYMENMFNATGFVPEKEVDYWIEYKMCDYIMRVNDQNIGVSVTRAVTYPFDNEFTYEHAMKLLDKKLFGLIVAQESVNTKHQFFKSILHIWCYSTTSAQNIKKAHDELRLKDISLTYDNIYVICSICHDKYIYTNHLRRP